MKVTFIFPGSYPYGRSAPRRAHLLCKGLVENGIEVLMLITGPTEEKENKYNLIPNGYFEGVEFKYIGGKVIRNENLFIRQMAKIRCILLLFINILTNKYKSDFLIVLGASFDYRMMLPVLARFTKTKSVLEINEYPLVTRQETPVVKIKRWILFHFVFHFYDGFVSISNGLYNLVNTYKSSKGESIIIPIIAKNIDRGEKYPNPVESPYIFHAGSLIEQKDGILGMIEAFGLAKRNLSVPLKFVFTGGIDNSPQKSEILKMIDKYELNNDIIFTGFLMDGDLDLYFRNSSLAIINKGETLQNQYCFASKTAEYLAYSIAVITTNVGEAGFYFIDSENAYVIIPNNPQLLADKIIQAFTNTVERERIAVNGKRLFDLCFDYKVQCKRLCDFLVSLI